MSSFERYAVDRILKQATAVGVEIPAEMANLTNTLGYTSYPGRVWATKHPDDDAHCCWGAILKGHEGCTCWLPEYEVDQQEPQPITSPEDLQARPRMCGDCAFKPGSPERANEFTAEALMELPAKADPFWCHDGMRRPVRWRHPDGRVVPGSPDDWHPAFVGRIPYRADGRPALLCAGWASLAAKARKEGRSESDETE